MAYKSTLLSSLITIRYEDAINTLNDLVDSGIPALIPRDTPIDKKFANDPRKIINKIYKNSHIYPYNGTPPSYIWDM